MNKKIISIVAVIIIIAIGVVAVYSITGNRKESTATIPSPSEEETDDVVLSADEDDTPSEPEETVSSEPEVSEDVSEPEVSEEYTETVVELPLSGLKIGIDAGHQGKGNSEQEAIAPGSSETKAKMAGGTRGTTTGISEYELTLAVALLLQQKLTDLGAEVIMARTTNDVDISNIERATMMNEAGTDLCVRIHANGIENSSVKGAMMLIPSASYTAPINEASRIAGEIIFQSFLAATGAENDGVIERSDLTGFNWSTVPVCLIELGFMTNPDEDRLMATDEYRNLCAQGLADGILAWAAVK